MSFDDFDRVENGGHSPLPTKRLYSPLINSHHQEEEGIYGDIEINDNSPSTSSKKYISDIIDLERSGSFSNHHTGKIRRFVYLKDPDTIAFPRSIYILLITFVLMNHLYDFKTLSSCAHHDSLRDIHSGCIFFFYFMEVFYAIYIFAMAFFHFLNYPNKSIERTLIDHPLNLPIRLLLNSYMILLNFIFLITPPGEFHEKQTHYRYLISFLIFILLVDCSYSILQYSQDRLPDSLQIKYYFMIKEIVLMAYFMILLFDIIFIIEQNKWKLSFDLLELILAVILLAIGFFKMLLERQSTLPANVILLTCCCLFMLRSVHLVVLYFKDFHCK